MPDLSLAHDTLFAYTVRLLFGPRFFRHPEERDPDAWRNAVDTADVALAGVLDVGNSTGDSLKARTLRLQLSDTPLVVDLDAKNVHAGSSPRPKSVQEVVAPLDNDLSNGEGRASRCASTQNDRVRRLSSEAATTEVAEVRRTPDDHVAERIASLNVREVPEVVVDERQGVESARSSTTQITLPRDGLDCEKRQAHSYILVDWDGPNDPEVDTYCPLR